VPAIEPAAPEPRALPRTELGALQLGANKWADVYVDGQRLGRIPDRTRYELPAGTHHLRAVQPDCAPTEEQVEIRAGETTRVRLTIACP
jgi:hypothetical protein